MIYIKLQSGLSRLSKKEILSKTLFGDKCRQLLDLWVFEFIQETLYKCLKKLLSKQLVGRAF